MSTTRKSGYVLIARDMLEHPRFKPRGPFSDLEAWIWLICSAAHAPRDVPASNGRQRITIHLEPGQLTFSVRFLAQAWTWSDKRVQRFLSDLSADQSVTTQTTTGQTVITLCNWDKYQHPTKAATTQTTTQSTTQTTTKKKELKELNSDVVGTREREVPAPNQVKVSPEKTAAVALGLAFLNAAGFEDYAVAPPNLYGATDRAALWIACGWTEEMIVRVTRGIAAASSDQKPIGYFEKAFANAAAHAQRPLPAASPTPQGAFNATKAAHPRNGGGNLAGALTARIADAKRRRDEAGRGGNLAGAANRLIAEAKLREQEALTGTDQTATVLNSWRR
jgi:DNA-binding transcriptional regulator YhcF (GntR family)